MAQSCINDIWHEYKYDTKGPGLLIMCVYHTFVFCQFRTGYKWYIIGRTISQNVGGNNYASFQKKQQQQTNMWKYMVSGWTQDKADYIDHRK